MITSSLPKNVKAAIKRLFYARFWQSAFIYFNNTVCSSFADCFTSYLPRVEKVTTSSLLAWLAKSTAMLDTHATQTIS